MSIPSMLKDAELLVFESYTKGRITELERNLLIDSIKAKQEEYRIYSESVNICLEKIKETLSD